MKRIGQTKRVRKYRRYITARQHKVRPRADRRAWGAARERAMGLVHGWCGAEDGVDDRYAGLWKFRYYEQRIRRNKLRGTRLVEQWGAKATEVGLHGLADWLRVYRRYVDLKHYGRTWK